MALKAKIHRVQLQVADMERHYYAEHGLTVAQHPSETDGRMMLRLLAFARHADESLAFGRGVSTEDEPDLWLKDLTGAIEHWIQLGQPDEKSVRRACARAGQVTLYTYGGNAAELWWEQNAGRLAALDNLTVVDVAPRSVEALAELVDRSMTLNCTLQDGMTWMTTPERSVDVALTWRKQRG
ncbi:YaeQ family protein [Halomonas campisalis]|uniref:YaeQ family protein n=1 Tax=Billgrantia campisalis TaxID=74661 RepID=A0ABS9P6C6_9GAMM|nr:YaeQ family protein [Halomonas campisalis]MCG6657161.1 YaeQ family protein [Halomonas campisalis]MDR5862346.1 YaeQ family protein [Halomonas campisalis]